MTQLATLKAAFNRGETLSVARALNKYGIFALSQRCGELIREGYPLQKGWVISINKARVRSYYKVRTNGKR